MTTTPLTGLGRRKTAIARVRLVTTVKTRTVNGIAFDEYFPTVSMQSRLLHPLQVTSQDNVFGFEVKVQGGGKNSQADAVRLGIARALLKDNADRKKELKEADLLTRDPREKERKKPGLKRARRAPQFSKR